MLIIPMWLQIMIDAKCRRNQEHHADFFYYYPLTGHWAKRMANNRLKHLGWYYEKLDTVDLLLHRILTTIQGYQSDYPRYLPMYCYRYAVLEGNKVYMAEETMQNLGDQVPWKLPIEELTHRNKIPPSGFQCYDNHNYSCYYPLTCKKYYSAKTYHFHANAIIDCDGYLTWKYLCCRIPTHPGQFTLERTVWCIPRRGKPASPVPVSRGLYVRTGSIGLGDSYNIEDVKKTIPKIIIDC